MKHKGCTLEFAEQRNRELLRAFKKEIAESERIDTMKIAYKIVDTKCSRFWVSEERALSVIAKIFKGEDILKSMRGTKREMFLEIYRRVADLRKSHPKASLTSLIAKVINAPAPKFYMKPRCAMEIIYKIRKPLRKQ